MTDPCIHGVRGRHCDSCELDEANTKIERLQAALRKIFDIEMGSDDYEVCGNCCDKDEIALAALKEQT